VKELCSVCSVFCVGPRAVARKAEAELTPQHTHAARGDPAAGSLALTKEAMECPPVVSEMKNCAAVCSDAHTAVACSALIGLCMISNQTIGPARNWESKRAHRFGDVGWNGSNPRDLFATSSPKNRARWLTLPCVVCKFRWVVFLI